MNKWLVFAALLHSFNGTSVFAGAPFQASVISSQTEAQRVYDMLPTDAFKGRSGCFQRAHYWSHLMSERFAINSMKVFLFFTDRYKREFDYDWTYHVAPLIPTQMNDGSIQELVFDPTFTQAPASALQTEKLNYDNKPISINEWLRYFIFPNTECKVIQNFDDFVSNQELEYCYVMKAPMFNYIPNNFLYDQEESESSGGTTWFSSSLNARIDWRPGDLEQMMNALKNQTTYRKDSN